MHERRPARLTIPATPMIDRVRRARQPRRLVLARPAARPARAPRTRPPHAPPARAPRAAPGVRQWPPQQVWVWSLFEVSWAAWVPAWVIVNTWQVVSGACVPMAVAVSR